MSQHDGIGRHAGFKIQFFTSPGSSPGVGIKIIL